MRFLSFGGLLALLVVGSIPASGCGECNHRLAESDEVTNTWTLSPDTLRAERLNVPVVVDQRLRIGYDDALNRNGHPNSRATTSFACGSGTGGTCHVSYTFGSRRGAARDNEKLTVRFSNATDSETLSLAHAGSGATGLISLTGCGTVNVEVTADAGTDATGIESAFEFSVNRSACSNCPTAVQQ